MSLPLASLYQDPTISGCELAIAPSRFANGKTWRKIQPVGRQNQSPPQSSQLCLVSRLHDAGLSHQVDTWVTAVTAREWGHCILLRTGQTDGRTGFCRWRPKVMLLRFPRGIIARICIAGGIDNEVAPAER